MGIRWNINDNEWVDTQKQNGQKNVLANLLHGGIQLGLFCPMILTDILLGKNEELISKIRVYWVKKE